MIRDDWCVPLFDISMCLSNAMDLISPKVVDHNKRVAYIAVCIAGEMGLSENEQEDALTNKKGYPAFSSRISLFSILLCLCYVFVSFFSSLSLASAFLFLCFLPARNDAAGLQLNVETFATSPRLTANIFARSSCITMTIPISGRKPAYKSPSTGPIASTIRGLAL